MSGAPYHSHGYVQLKFGGGGDVIIIMGTQQPRELGKWKLFHLENGLYRVQSGVFPTKFGHKLLLSLSAQLDNV